MSVPLDGWRLADSAPDPGTEYIIPNGYTIPAGGRLVVWCDDETVQSSVPGNLHVPFKLSNGGETLTLKAPDGTVVDTVTFGPQYDNVTQGRSSDGTGAIEYLSSPSPGTANAGAPPLPAITFSKTGTAVTFTLSVLPNFRYRVEYKDNLSAVTWTPLGASVVATGTTLQFTDPNAPGPQRFYRAIRTP